MCDLAVVVYVAGNPPRALAARRIVVIEVVDAIARQRGVQFGRGIGLGDEFGAVRTPEGDLVLHSFAPGLFQHPPVRGDDLELEDRSEEHTSELQSLMRISYAVLCLKKKKKNRQ